MRHVGVRPLRTLRSNPVMSGCVSWSPDGTSIATGHYRSARIWDVHSGECRAKLDHPGVVGAVAWHPDGDHLLTACDDLGVRLWDVGTCSVARVFGQQDTPRSLAWRADGALFVVTCGPNIVRVCDERGATLFRTSTHPGHVASVSWVRSPGAARDRLAVSAGRRVQVWDPGANAVVSVLTHYSKVTDATASPDGLLMATSERSGMVRLWDVESSERVGKVPTPARLNTLVSWNPTSPTVAVGSANGSLCVLDVEKSRVVRRTEGHQRPLGAAAWNRDGTLLVSCGVFESVRLWDLSTSSIGLAARTAEGDVGLGNKDS